MLCQRWRLGRNGIYVIIHYISKRVQDIKIVNRVLGFCSRHSGCKCWNCSSSNQTFVIDLSAFDCLCLSRHLKSENVIRSCRACTCLNITWKQIFIYKDIDFLRKYLIMKVIFQMSNIYLQITNCYYEPTLRMQLGKHLKQCRTYFGKNYEN